MVPLKLIVKTVMEVARYLSGVTGPGITEPISLQHWIIQFGEARGNLLLTFADLVEWLAKERPPWAAYCVLMSGRLMVLDNNSRVRSMGMGDTWWRLLPKCVLKVAGLEAKEGCITDQLCEGMEARIEIGIHVMRLLGGKHVQE